MGSSNSPIEETGSLAWLRIDDDDASWAPEEDVQPAVDTTRCSDSDGKVSRSINSAWAIVTLVMLVIAGSVHHTLTSALRASPTSRDRDLVSSPTPVPEKVSQLVPPADIRLLAWGEAYPLEWLAQPTLAPVVESLRDPITDTGRVELVVQPFLCPMVDSLHVVCKENISILADKDRSRPLFGSLDGLEFEGWQIP